MPEPTRRLKDPVPDENGDLVGHSLATPRSFPIRGAVYIGPNKVIPVIFIPGTMGTNLRVRREVALPPEFPLKPGDSAWRPPNGDADAWFYAREWEQRSPRQRQLILNPDYVEVDDTGDLDIGPCNLDHSVMRERGWGEIFNGPYGNLLFELQSHLEMTFRFDALNQRQVREHWREVIKAMEGDALKRWGVRSVEPLSESDLETYAQYQYPVYACGYNWLQSSGESAKRLEKRINDILKWWQARKHECRKVILVTHSMGGLVARACAKRMPDQIAGIVHGVMPALGAPLAYRRLACGTECGNPADGPIEKYKGDKFADVAGRRPEDTTPVLSVAPGALELLPNHLHPRPWLHVRIARNSGPTGPRETHFDYLHLPDESQPNPYDLYRDMHSWYRLINPELANPAELYKKHKGGVVQKIYVAIDIAEKFHSWLSDYYHPTTFAYYGADKNHLAFGKMRWIAHEPSATTGVPITVANVKAAKYLAHDTDGTRTIEVEGKFVLSFSLEQQDSAGDDTVSNESGSGPGSRIKNLFATRGYKHQESYKNHDSLLLTRYCIVKIVLEFAKHGKQK
jgi:pimeloyl-ACP methyl ester carboxylesterase